MKVFQSSSFFKIFSGTRASAIVAAIHFLNELIANSEAEPHARYTWRADDESGFTIQIKETTGGYVAVCVSKWNATRDKAERTAEDNFRNRHED